jgi:hypothetical protein
MGGSMMVPVPFVLWGLGLAFFMFCLLLGIKGITGGWGGWVGERWVWAGCWRCWDWEWGLGWA